MRAADDGGTSRRRPFASGAAPLQRRPAAVGREDGTVDVGAVVAEQEGDGGASCAAVAGAGMVTCMRGPRRSAASLDPQSATMLVIVAPGATALKRRPLGPYITAAFLVRPTTACLDAV